jgi:hypothetical protein
MYILSFVAAKNGGLRFLLLIEILLIRFFAAEVHIQSFSSGN